MIRLHIIEQVIRTFESGVGQVLPNDLTPEEEVEINHRIQTIMASRPRLPQEQRVWRQSRSEEISPDTK